MLPERLRILFTQFRLGNTKLPIETGRWFNIDINKRCCTLCNRNEIGDGFHLLFQCDALRYQRKRFMPKYSINPPNSFKFFVLFNVHSLNKLISICKLIKIKIDKFN